MDNICLKNIKLGIIPTKNIRLCRTQLHHRLSPKKERFLVPSILIILSYYYIICWNSGPQRHVSHLEIYHIIYMAVPSGTCDDKIKGGWIYIQWIPYRSLLSTNKHNVKKKKKNHLIVARNESKMRLCVESFLLETWTMALTFFISQKFCTCRVIISSIPIKPLWLAEVIILSFLCHISSKLSRWLSQRKGPSSEGIPFSRKPE